MTRRVLVTDAEDFVGPAAVERFRAGGDSVVAHAAPLGARADVGALVADEGPFDVVIANLDAPITVSSITDHNDDITGRLFERLVNPLSWFSHVVAGFGPCLVHLRCNHPHRRRLDPLTTFRGSGARSACRGHVCGAVTSRATALQRSRAAGT